MNIIEIHKLNKTYKRTTKVSRFIDIFEFKSGKESFQALEDVNISIKKGERVGIVGPNGAGKSTLIKILSRITPPTSGEVKIRGRVTSLLEVGTGFHPDLSGRDNIYMKGILLGMSKPEVDEKYNEIVKFTEIEGFMDDPIRKYSSGMRLRLAFSICVHLKSDILLLDEVLAVGDPGFQKKCIQKIKQISLDGKTVLLVSHDLERILNFAERIVFLDHGKVMFNDSKENFLSFLENYGSHYRTSDTGMRKGYGNARFLMYSIISNQPVKTNDQLEIKIRFKSKVNISNGNLTFRLTNALGKTVLSWRYKEQIVTPLQLSKGIYDLILSIKEVNLMPGVYYLSMSIVNNEIIEAYIENAMAIKINPPEVENGRRTPAYSDTFVYSRANWQIKEVNQ